MKDILSVEQVRSMVKDAAPLVQSDEVSLRADLACHVLALADTVETMQAEIERLREALWRIVTIVGFNPDGPHRGRDCAEIAHAALGASEEPRP